MATNATTLSLSFATTSSSSSLPSYKPLFSKRSVSFSTVPYLVVSHSSKPRVSTPFALAAVVNDQTAIVDGEQKPRKLGNPTPVYVCNLPRSCDNQQLIQIFTPHGTVLSAEVCRNAETGESKGSAYVTMGSYNAAKNAIDALDGLDVGGREVRVKFSIQMNTKKKNSETLNPSPWRTIYYEGPYKVYIGNLARSTTPEDLRNLFGKFGNVASARVLHDFKQGKNRVYAFVSYLTQTERDASLSLNGTEFDSRSLVVREGVEKTVT
ncbi:small ribosomal subunit protein cS22 [Vicia villosa]|uniref:small ribosomal subunit protein cS22 n=1 Tax=Vicia villosa TaxID=3911 RepID=UPI00273A8225|nr:small ribosomal subunit protein cS22 [Vicia villosa]